jgi:3-isopropylmalate dehydratase small subunit
MNPVSGAVFLLGDDVNTDVLHPSRYYSLSAETRAAGLLAGSRKEEMTGRIIVAGRNFGVGSSRESVIRGFVESGIIAIIAVSISRIFLRNAINAGLPAVVCPGVHDAFEQGETISLDLDRQIVEVASRDIKLPIEPLDPYLLQVLKSGGLIAQRGWK